MVVEINEENFEEKIQEKCVVDFFATWCPPCKMLSPILEEVSSEIEDVKFYKINVDENTNISEKYGISVVPTLIFFEGAEDKKKISGYIDKKQLTEFIKN